MISSIARRAIKAPLARSSALPTRLTFPRQSLFISPILLATRSAANSVSGRPGSQTLGHASTNIKEEVGHSASDFAKTIAGGTDSASAAFAQANAKSLGSFLGITSAVAANVPKPVMVLGLAGSLPYLGTSLASVYYARQASDVIGGLVGNMDPGMAITLLNQSLNIQVTYGAVMLSFLGALHWGMEFSALGGQKGYPRLLLGIAPALVAWPTLALQPTVALAVQWFAFTGLWYADMKATSAGWTPPWYSQYRFYLSILVGTCILGSLAGVNVWGPVPGIHSAVTHEVEQLKAKRLGDVKGGRKGLLPSASHLTVTDGTDADADAYVLIGHPKEGENNEESGEKEGQKEEEKGDEKDGEKDEKDDKKDEKDDEKDEDSEHADEQESGEK